MSCVDRVLINLHHGGKFVSSDEYVSGESLLFREWDVGENTSGAAGLNIELDEEDDLEDGLSTDDEEYEEARKILREERLRQSQNSEEQCVTQTGASQEGEFELTAESSLIDEVELDTDDDIDIVEDDDDSISKKNRKLFVKTSNPGELKLEIGLTFKDTTECKRAVRNWAIENGYDIKWNKSARGKLQAVCRGDCKWKLYDKCMD